MLPKLPKKVGKEEQLAPVNPVQIISCYSDLVGS